MLEREFDEIQEHEFYAAEEWPLEEITPRAGGNTRPLAPKHVFGLAMTIHELGLIEPIVIDRDGRLIAGGHRLMAMKLLQIATRSSTIQRLKRVIKEDLGARDADQAHRELDQLREDLPSEPSIDPQRIPVRVFNFDSSQDIDRALEIEISENSHRRDYTSKEILRLYELLLSKGYTDQRGRPREGSRAAKPMLATLIGRSVRTVKRKLEEARMKEAQRGADHEPRQEALRVIKRMKGLTRALRRLSPEASAVVRASLEAQHYADALLIGLTEISEGEEEAIDARADEMIEVEGEVYR
jgi:hypothetical protein